MGRMMDKIESAVILYMISFTCFFSSFLFLLSNILEFVFGVSFLSKLIISFILLLIGISFFLIGEIFKKKVLGIEN